MRYGPCGRLFETKPGVNTSKRNLEHRRSGLKRLMSKLQDQLDQITANTRNLVQPERLEISERAVAELYAAGVEDQHPAGWLQGPGFCAA